MLQLRSYQLDVIDRITSRRLDGDQRIVVKMPTGSGKTALAGQLIREAMAANQRVVFIVPFLSLIDQTVERLFQYGIRDIGVIQSDHPLRRPFAMVQVCSAQTLIRRQFPVCDLIIVDEAHKQFHELNQWLINQRRVIGLTATPWAKGMANVYDSLVADVTIDDLIDEGYLVPVKALVPEARPDLSHMNIRRYEWGPDYQQRELSRRMRDHRLTGDIIETWKQNSSTTKTLIFAVDLSLIHI